MAKGVEADYRPIDITATFDPKETLYCAVRVADMPRGATVSARWYYGETFINETFYVATPGGSGWIGFQLTSTEPWPAGDYNVKIHYEDRFWKTVYFRVQ